jgi:RHS repeat-associated protein
VRQVLDSGGGVLFAQAFDPYDNPYASVGTGSTRFGFTGEHTDENGLIFLRARYYDPRQGRFLQRDPWRGEADRLMSYNDWLYVGGNPINGADFSGLCLDEDLDGFCDLPGKGPDGYASALAAFSEEKSAPRWTRGEKITVDNALWNVSSAYQSAYQTEVWRRLMDPCDSLDPRNVTLLNHRFSSIQLFRLLHGGKIEFVRKANRVSGYWAYTISSREIWIYANASESDVAENRRFIVHEVGHAFENALLGTLGAKKGRDELPGELVNREGGFAGGFTVWQWSKEETAGEIFADMFIGWVYNRWETIGTELAPLGQQRADYMHANMGGWIVEAVLVRIAKGQRG